MEVFDIELDPAWIPPDYEVRLTGGVAGGVGHRSGAPTPWGPWSLPQRIWHPLDQENGVDGYCSILFHPERANADPSCVQADIGRDGNGATTRQEAIEAVPFGVFGQEYGVSIVEDLSQPITGGARVYWVMSTWNPYRVVLMETELPVF